MHTQAAKITLIDNHTNVLKQVQFVKIIIINKERHWNVQIIGQCKRVILYENNRFTKWGVDGSKEGQNDQAGHHSGIPLAKEHEESLRNMNKYCQFHKLIHNEIFFLYNMIKLFLIFILQA